MLLPPKDSGFISTLKHGASEVPEGAVKLSTTALTSF
jgi:hypothetical protein